MASRWLGVVVSGDKVTIVDAEVPDTGPLVIQADESWPLQQGERVPAYVVMAQQVSNYVTENRIKLAVVKASAVSLGGTKKAHLESAELRGVVMAALGTITNVELRSKGVISKTFGKRKVDAYVKDDGFWQKECVGQLRSGSREAAMVLLAARKPK
ncbi:hypothetical protein [Bradyrhizobium sp. S69]|uniref:hypothetical protein n=1 Tax=Bradyrhizobium sp. S69 TaxID=1641856 RepID=UPI00131BD71F|nr:hypothetical protein [Bradyrhizobium sp. S69]